MANRIHSRLAPWRWLALAPAPPHRAAAALGRRATPTSPIYGFDSPAPRARPADIPTSMVRVEVGDRSRPSGVEPCFCNAIRDLTVNTPPGLSAIPHATSRSARAAELSADSLPDRQPGRRRRGPPRSSPIARRRLLRPAALQHGAAARDSWRSSRPSRRSSSSPIYTIVSARTESDYGLESRPSGSPRLIPPNEITQITWGVPADPIHDDLRWLTDRRSKPASCGSGNPLAELLENVFPTTLLQLRRTRRPELGDQPADSVPAQPDRRASAR